MPLSISTIFSLLKPSANAPDPIDNIETRSNSFFMADPFLMVFSCQPWTVSCELSLPDLGYGRHGSHPGGLDRRYHRYQGTTKDDHGRFYQDPKRFHGEMKVVGHGEEPHPLGNV